MTARERFLRLKLRLLLPTMLPASVRRVMARLEAAGFSAHLVGGCVRDLLLGRRPPDWDLATSARPDGVLRLFPGSVPTGVEHGTVTVTSGGRPLQVTTYRVEGPYGDHRHPDRVWFTEDLSADLRRRDVTINALAADRRGRLVDVVGGLGDLLCRRLRAVGDPDARFAEDALRPLRVVRLAAQLGFEVDGPTWEAVERAAPALARVSAERVREELSRILLSPRPRRGVELLRDSGMLGLILPRLEPLARGQGPQGLWEHLLSTLELAPPRLEVRLAALFHDLGLGAEPGPGPASAGPERRWSGPGAVRAEAGRAAPGPGRHPEVGAAAAREMLERLRFDARTTAAVETLVRWHETLTACPPAPWPQLRAVGAGVGRPRLEDLAWLRAADEAAACGPGGRVIGGALPRRARRVARGRWPLRVEELALGGREVMALLGLKAGPEVGRVLERLLEAVLEDPRRNTRRRLAALAREAGRTGAGG
ncbi:MAG: CCA tRNA nucleotidyltransferase [Acetobacteraceae bacterium]|nr:CCA tRNA nucleotidyltransferase [Acetobacteraceae bacterium]